jgi:hypothetical protein
MLRSFVTTKFLAALLLASPAFATVTNVTTAAGLISAVGTCASGDTVNAISSGTYVFTTTLTINCTIITISGYQTTPGDNGTKPVFTTATNSTPLFGINGHVTFENVSFSNTAATSAVAMWAGGTPYLMCNRCVFTGFTDALNGDNGAHNVFTDLWIFLTEIYGNQRAIRNAGNTVIVGCYIHGNSTAAANSGVLDSQSQAMVIVNTLIVGNTASGSPSGVIWGSQGHIILANDTIAGNTGDGIDSDYIFSTNTIYYGNSGWAIQGVDTTTPNLILADTSNAFGSNTSGNIRGLTVSASDISVSVSPFTASGSGDYSLNAAATGGALLKGAATPSLFPGGLSTGHGDIGAVQSAGGAAASATASAFAY